MELRKAQKRKSKLRIGLSAPSGAGKTYSALLMASGMASSFEKVCLIDTENGSGDLYEHLGDYNVITLKPPFSPERYIQAIKSCEKAGMEVIIIDSISHEWEGIGGCLEINEAIAKTKFRGNTWSAWSETGERHNKFLQAIIGSDCHIITTVRNKVEMAQVKEGSKTRIQKVGTKEITREGFEYEVTVNLTIERDSHCAMASKDRTGIFDSIDPFVITKKTGETLMKWANSGVEPIKEEPKKEEKTGVVFTDELIKKYEDYIKSLLSKGMLYDEIFEKMKKANFILSDEIKTKIKEISQTELPDDDWTKKADEKLKKPTAKKEAQKEVKKEESQKEDFKIDDIVERIDKVHNSEELKTIKEMIIKSNNYKKTTKDNQTIIDECIKDKENQLMPTSQDLDI